MTLYRRGRTRSGHLFWRGCSTNCHQKSATIVCSRNALIYSIFDVNSRLQVVEAVVAALKATYAQPISLGRLLLLQQQQRALSLSLHQACSKGVRCHRRPFCQPRVYAQWRPLFRITTVQLQATVQQLLHQQPITIRRQTNNLSRGVCQVSTPKIDLY